MLTASVSNVDLYRVWRDDEELDLPWLLSRLRGDVEQTPQMKAGEAFHKALEIAVEGEVGEVTQDGYTFQFLCECEVAIPTLRELRVTKQYGDVLVRGRVDAVEGRMVIDHKTTGQFDADRLMSGYQWRFYLDMMDCDTFRWNVFVLKETDYPKVYTVSDFHALEQRRYPELHADCERLANEYASFARQNL